MTTKIKKMFAERFSEFDNKPITQMDNNFLYEMRVELAKAKRNKQCTWCGAKYKLKDFRTRTDKDERDLSGMCQDCIDDTQKENKMYAKKDLSNQCDDKSKCSYPTPCPCDLGIDEDEWLTGRIY